MTRSKKELAYDKDSPQFTREMMKRSLRFQQLPQGLQQTLRAIQDGRKKPNKVAVSIRLSQDVVDQLRASGSGWQSRVDEALRTWLRDSQKAS